MARRNKRNLLKVTALAGLLTTLTRRAEKTLQDPEKVQALVNDAQRHAAAAQQRGIMATALAPLGIMGRMTRAYVRREYRTIPWATVGATTAALLYFVMPFDFVPDILAGFGLVDDLALVTFLLTKVKDDLDRFVAWEEARDAAITVDSRATVVADAAAAAPADTGAMEDVVVAEPAAVPDMHAAAESIVDAVDAARRAQQG